MRCLTFLGDPGEPSVRRAAFEERSWLPLSAACLVAANVRETLGALLGIPLQTRLFEPAIPREDGWREIGRDATLYRVRGSVSDAAIVLRLRDATAMAAAAFGESAAPAEPPRPLSPLERDILDRAVASIAGALVPVCGPYERDSLERIPSMSGFRSYFEIAIDPPVGARIGVALSHDAPPEPAGSLTVDVLRGVEVRVDAIVDVARVTARAVASLRTGDVFPLHGWNAARLTVAGRTVGTGPAGIRNDRYALSLGAGA
ncbi:MAG: FliM/FliN family flagellar motor C-terminal domain-containing protein [Candidatus Tumulicola sp.]